jgi:hypothetical protein
MTTTNHAITGAFIAALVKQPFLAIPLAFLSHFVCDALPHFDVKFQFGQKSMYQYLAADGFVAILAGLFLLWRGVHNPILLAVCGFAAMSPDLFWLYYGIRGRLGKYELYGMIAKFHHNIQWSATKWGIIPEAVWAYVFLGLILKLQ